MADPHWLQELVNAQRATDADAVAGVVKYLFPEKFPKYLRKTWLYTLFLTSETEPYRIPCFDTNNVLLRASAIDRCPAFAPELARIGLEDTDLAIHFDTQNRTIYRAPRAVVTEIQPMSRGRWRFFFERAVRNGFSLGIVARKNFGRIVTVQFLLKRTCSRLFSILKKLVKLPFHPCVQAADISFELGHIIGYLLYFLGIRWRGY